MEKKSRKLPLILGLLLGAVLLGYLAATLAELPARVASHFGVNGQPDGWMTRNGYALFVVGMALGLPAVVIGMSYVSRFFPVYLLNVPNRKYWTAPERRQKMYDFIFAHSLWFGPISALFFMGLHFVTLEANRAEPAQLSFAHLMWVVGLFLVLELVWVLTLIRPLVRVPKS